MSREFKYIRWLEDISAEDAPDVGAKNALLGELMPLLDMYGIRVPDGFAVTGGAYRHFMASNSLVRPVRSELRSLRREARPVDEVGASIRKMILNAALPPEITEEISAAYRELPRRNGGHEFGVAVRSSPTAENPSGAAFAGLHDTFLNVHGEAQVIDAYQRCCASLFSDRAISYWESHDLDCEILALSVGIQVMVRCDLGASGTLNTVNTKTGFPDVVEIAAVWGLRMADVDGTDRPDAYVVYKPLLENRSLRPTINRALGVKNKKVVCSQGGSTELVETSDDERRGFALDDNDVLTIARWAAAVEGRFDWPIEIEWAKDGESGDLFVLEARPEMVHSKREAGTLHTYRLAESGRTLIEGYTVGGGIAAGRVSLLKYVADAGAFEDGDVLVVPGTDREWLPLIRRAVAVVADLDGASGHTAMACYELGVPAVTGTGRATLVLRNGQPVTVSCADPQTGRVYEGRLDFEEDILRPEDVPEIHTGIMLNVATPDAALRWWNLPVNGVGMARTEFIISDYIKIHPLALLRFDEIESAEDRERIAKVTEGYDERAEYFVERMADCIGQIAASQHPLPAVVRFSDLTSEEYARLVGGRQFEPSDKDRALGLRGASRYVSDLYRPAFELECRALRRVRDVMGLKNVAAMIPLCRTPEEADSVRAVLESYGLRRGDGGFKLHVMVEVPSNIEIADEYAACFDGLSIAGVGLSRLSLGTNGHSAPVFGLSDDMKVTVRRMLESIIARAHDARIPVSFCGGPPTDDGEFITFLVDAGIDSIAVSPYGVAEVIRHVAEAENGGDSRRRGP